MVRTELDIAFGFTLLEVVIVASILITVAALGLFMSFGEYRASHFRDERTIIRGALQKMRSQALSHMCFDTTCDTGVPHGVYFGRPGHYVLYEGTSYTERHGVLDEFIEAEPSVRIEGCTDIVFSVGSADATCLTGELPITITTGERASSINVSPDGRIWWND